MELVSFWFIANFGDYLHMHFFFFMLRCREQLPEYAEYDVTDEAAGQADRLQRVLLG